MATKSIYNITDMRRRFLSSTMGADEVRLHTNGISVLLAKTKIDPLGENVFRIMADEVRLPKDLFTGELRDALQYGSVQVVLYSYFEKRCRKRAQNCTSQLRKVVWVDALSFCTC